MVTVTSYGAAQTVTGSCHLVKIGSIEILIDCGMFQGGVGSDKNYKPFDFDPSKVNYLILTHAHLDHIGRVPKLVKDGFTGKIIATNATRDIAKIMLLDSAGILYEEFKTMSKKARRRGEEESVLEPLYTKDDVKAVFAKKWCTLDYFEEHKLKQHVRVSLGNAGHIMGSAFVMIDYQEENKHKRMVFSGDLGSPQRLIIDNPDKIDKADTLFIESTYGDRNHKPLEQSIEEFKEAVSSTLRQNGSVIIPSFALERTQEILWLLHEMHDNGELPKCRIFLDSPLAIKATKLYNQYQIHLNDELQYRQGSGEDPFSFAWLEHTSTRDQSMRINKVKERSIIIAGSGMCNGGRIMHHLKHRLWNPKNAIVFVGYQVKGTLGRSIVDGEKSIKIYGEDIVAKAKIYTINGFSAHADQHELIEWMRSIKNLKKLCLIHGEIDKMEIFASVIKNELRHESHIMDYGVSLKL
ncbi:MAG: MBL fold metallo-hydrolase [Sulfurimonas sp. RIFOXYD12_FULL_33_39]|uniref:MBL fold metallo-hydrolase RNA specificity domain-containing protein n=1 Tax=unclassified Sulfurimonas TaxID=2623549 RepID=UPI0008D4FC13|nr:MULTISPECIES: MBL fold metallo-hydrolase [unclassified Sulfurimonas]OHE03538.1 MAG: MBL fold metallo-hydrolase [Sulfurimonas sp. RIFCSPLOWO2_12_FULL_34_6]OHE09237.1 MAG: MBL fold metallo-hydrolase [Sulfurimonas sp. RIFOXYD12_FULL_33_39]OHE12980.1 MAG: MBL fold metallo-hydrolase [Sulfurimonas sp. RIFOXYD2_FULL_34_21]DAB27276.1 MAG TPA: MBL fold metallo-hydrolase [Sulfurimonas sp. UBA10385]